MAIVTRVTPGTVEVRINDAAQRKKWKHVEDVTVIKFANIGLMFVFKFFFWNWRLINATKNKNK